MFLIRSPHQYTQLIKFHFSPSVILVTVVSERLEAEEFSLTWNQIRSSLVTLNPGTQTIRRGVFVIENIVITRCNYWSTEKKEKGINLPDETVVLEWVLHALIKLKFLLHFN